ncbi:MAG: radical SAM protein [Deltaproteobacteria bacterium]|nr:radical SAM protein [Deltaproteobacteria bacterium]
MHKPRVLLALPRYRGFNHGLFLGIACLATALKQSGADVEVFDEDVAAQAETKTGCNAHQILDRVLETFKPTLVGVHVNTPNYAAALQLSKRLREVTDVPIVAGGPHATVATVCLLSRHAQFDYVLRGEADDSLPVLAWALTSNRLLDDIPGLSRRIGSSVVHVVHNDSPPLLDCRRIPKPDRGVFLNPPDPDLRKYARSTYLHNFTSSIPGFSGRMVAGAFSSRGCGYSCPFCSPSAFWADTETSRPVRRLRLVEDLIGELKEVRDLGYGAVFFDEPTFPMSSERVWIEEFTKQMKNLGLLWGAPTRLEELDPELLPQLADSGFRYAYFGLETPQPDLQSRIGKHAEIKTVHERLRACEDNGIQCDVSLLFGGPGETDETVDATLLWMDQCLPQGNAFFSLAAYWPGTAWSQAAGLTPEFWEPDFDHKRAEDLGLIWYPESATSIERFYSNSTGTYHPAFLSVERALRIKERIISSGFRARFSQYARTLDAPEFSA